MIRMEKRIEVIEKKEENIDVRIKKNMGRRLKNLELVEERREREKRR